MPNLQIALCESAFAFALPNPLSRRAMRPDRTTKKGGTLLDWWLIFSVHLDGFRVDPRRYLIASWWRLRGKRLRARAQLDPLLGMSPKAYGLRLLREKSAPVFSGASDATMPKIVALVDVSDGKDGLQASMQSLAADGVLALPVGEPHALPLEQAVRSIDWSENVWVVPMTVGDTIAPGTAAAYRTAIASTQSSILYADDDLLATNGRRCDPHFKPDWNSELFRHFDYLTGACAVHATRADLEALADDEDWARQLTLRALANGMPHHVRRMLHHRRWRPEPHVPPRPDVPRGELPSVTVIVPTRNRVDLLKTCLSGIENTDYPEIDVIVADNGSDDPTTLAYLDGLDPARYRVLRCPGPFNFSTINNRAADEARGQLLCLLNNDIEVIEPNWLATMAVQAMRDDVGAVGAQLLYPDGRMQHAGVVLGVGNGAAHAHRLLRPEDEGYFRRHALPQFTSAVTAACLVVQRDRFRAIDGFDERNFAVAFNDVDLCMRLNQRGWQSFYEPRATLIHHESVSRGFDRDREGAARLAREMTSLQSLWRTNELVDPYHHPELSRASERFVVQL